MSKKGMRDGIDKEKIMKSMTENDWERIKEQKSFGILKHGTYGYKLAIECDSLNLREEKMRSELQKAIWSVENAKNHVRRMKVELNSDKITTELKPGVPMTKDELKTQVKYQEWLLEGFAKDVKVRLAEIRTLVGYQDVAGQVIITEEKFEELAEKVEGQMESLGFKLFCRV